LTWKLFVFHPRVCFVDVETTGSSPARERVTEVGVVTVDADGDSVRVQEWSSLVNPGVPIPPEIQWLTGITNVMVREAPGFAALADELADRLRDAIFVAHNARFDYGFLKAEFARAGITWSTRTLCTVRLSRLLYPDRGPHSLDAIVARFGIEGEQRHRALGDARVLWRLLQRLYQRHPRGELDAAIARLLSRPATPPHLPPEALDEIAHAPGVYLFYGLNAHPIYIGKSIDVRDRVADHFDADNASSRDARLSQEVRRIEWEETAGEIGALLREVELVKTLLPAHNIALRRKHNQVVFTLDDEARPRFAPALGIAPATLARIYGPFSSRAAARALLLSLAREHGLCAKTLGLERRGGKRGDGRPCFNFQLGLCRGACAGVESPGEHAARAREMLAGRRIADWPYSGAVALREVNATRGREDVHVFDQWCWRGTARTAAAAAQLLQQPLPQFDPDLYRVVRAALERVARGALELTPLAP